MGMAHSVLIPPILSLISRVKGHEVRIHYMRRKKNVTNFLFMLKKATPTPTTSSTAAPQLRWAGVGLVLGWGLELVP